MTGFLVATTSPVPDQLREAATELGVRFEPLVPPLEPAAVARQLAEWRPHGYLLTWPDIGPRMTGELADAAGRLRVVTYAGQSLEPAFYTDALDLPALRRRGILATTMPGAEAAVAEAAMAFLFAFELALVPANHARKHRIAAPRSTRRNGLAGSSLGVVGMGRIGQRVAQLAGGCGMEVRYFSRTRHPEVEARGVRFLGLPELFATSDSVSLHLPKGPAERLVSEEILARANGITLINTTSIANLVEPTALLRALEQGRVARFGLEGAYPQPYDQALREYRDDRVLLMPPYSSYDTPAAERLGWQRYLETLGALLRDEPVPHQILPE